MKAGHLVLPFEEPRKSARKVAVSFASRRLIAHRSVVPPALFLFHTIFTRHFVLGYFQLSLTGQRCSFWVINANSINHAFITHGERLHFQLNNVALARSWLSNRARAGEVICEVRFPLGYSALSSDLALGSPARRPFGKWLRSRGGPESRRCLRFGGRSPGADNRTP